MVSSGVVALVVVALAQAVYGAPSCGCGAVYPAYPDPSYPVYGGLEEGCCPGPVVEKKEVITKKFDVPFSFTEKTSSRKCFQRPAGVDRKVIPSGYETAPVCETQETVVKVPTTDVQVQEQPLCRKTCTTSEYVIQIPIVETTCTSAPLCKKTVRTQDNVLTTVSKKTSCAKQVCTQNKIVEQPYTETVCQDYQGTITKAGSKTIYKPEVYKSCVQLPPRKCLKPATGPGTYVDYGNGPVAYDGAYPGAYYGDAVVSAPYYGDAVVSAPYYGDAAYVSGPAYYGPSYPEVASYGAYPVVDAVGYSGAYGYDAAPAYYGPGPVVSYDTLPAPYVPSCSCACA